MLQRGHAEVYLEKRVYGERLKPSQEAVRFIKSLNAVLTVDSYLQSYKELLRNLSIGWGHDQI